VRKMTVLGALLLLAAGLVASPAAAFAVPAGSTNLVPQLSQGSLVEAVPTDQGDVATSPDESDEVATGQTSALGFALIATALVGGGVTLTMLRRKGALGG